MFDIGWTELLVIGVVALIVVGPKDLPGMFRTLGRFTAKARSMAREFSRAMEDAADESGVGDVAKDLKAMTSIKNLGLDTIKDAAGRFEDWDPMKSKPADKKGPATAAMSKERAETAQKIRDAAAEKVRKREAKTKVEGSKAGTPKPPSKKPAKKKTVKQKPVTKRPKATGVAAVNATAAKASPAKPVKRKPATKKSAVKNAAAKPPSKGETK